MKRILVYSISSFLTAFGGFFFMKTPQENLLPQFKKDNQKKETNANVGKTDDTFPNVSLISVDKFGNILVADRFTKSKKVIYPNGQVKTFGLDESYDSNPSFNGSTPLAGGVGWGGGGVYGSSDYGGHYAGSSGLGESQTQATTIKKGRGQSSPGEETEKKDMGAREISSDSLGVSGGLGASGTFGRGLMDGGAFSAPTSGNSVQGSGETGFLPMASSDIWRHPESMVSPENPSANPRVSQQDTVSFSEISSSDEDTNTADPQYVTIPGAKKSSNSKSSSPPPQAPDRRQNAKKAQDSANNAIPPIMNNANEEKKKAEEERQKQNYQKAQEHDSKAAMLMAQAAAMAAAAAGNNNAKNKAGNDDGGGSSAPLIQTPLIFNYGDNQPKNEPQESSQPQVIAIYPNGPTNKLQSSSEIILADPNAVQ